MQNTVKKIFAAGISALLSISLAGCGVVNTGQSSGTGTTGAKKTGKLELVYLQKQGDQQYFVDEADGAKAQAKKSGNVDIKVINLGTDSNKAISETQAAIARGVDGVIMVAPDQSIGPRLSQLTKQANIPLLASDDILKDSSGKEVPFVGFDGTSMGKKVGAEAARLYKQEGWDAKDTRIISAGKLDLSVCKLRMDGAEAEFRKQVPDMPKMTTIGTDNSVTDALNRTGGVISANQGVKHWVVWGCNDQNETGVVSGLQNSGISPDDIIGVGLDADLTCKDWRAAKKTGNRAALYNSGHDVGATSVRVMVKSLREGTKMPDKTIVRSVIVNADNWQKEHVLCN